MGFLSNYSKTIAFFLKYLVCFFLSFCTKKQVCTRETETLGKEIPRFYKLTPFFGDEQGTCIARFLYLRESYGCVLIDPLLCNSKILNAIFKCLQLMESLTLREESVSAVASEFVSHLLTKNAILIPFSIRLTLKNMSSGFMKFVLKLDHTMHLKEMKKDVDFSAFNSSIWFLCMSREKS